MAKNILYNDNSNFYFRADTIKEHYGNCQC